MKTQDELIALFRTTCADKMPNETWWDELQPKDKEYMRRLTKISHCWDTERIAVSVTGGAWREQLSVPELVMVSDWDAAYWIGFANLRRKILMPKSEIKN